MSTKTALIVVDVQNDFCEGGSLAVAGGADAAEAIRRHIEEHRDRYHTVVATRDWHIEPGSHFAEGEPDYSETWPVHCAADTAGAQFHENLMRDGEPFDQVISKGQYGPGYSGFDGATDDDRRLEEVLAEADQVHVCGIATDFCVRATSLDSVQKGFDTTVLLDLCAGVNPDPTSTVDELIHGGVKVSSSGQALVAQEVAAAG